MRRPAERSYDARVSDTSSLPPVVEIERRIRWPAPAALAFLGILAMLLVVAIVPLVAPPHVLEGLPDDPDVRAAAERLRGWEPLPQSGLAFGSALFGREDARALALPPGTRAADFAEARRLLDLAHGRIGNDPRLRVFLAHLDLAAGGEATEAGDHRRALDILGRAARAYRGVADGRAEVPEARMGLGALLDFRADHETDVERQRGLRLMAIAQFAAVKEHERIYPAALYDRALLLARVGRRAEARRRAQEYFARDSVSVRAARLREEVGLGR